MQKGSVASLWRSGTAGRIFQTFDEQFVAVNETTPEHPTDIEYRIYIEYRILLLWNIILCVCLWHTHTPSLAIRHCLPPWRKDVVKRKAVRVCGTPALSPSLKYRLVNLASFGFLVIVNFRYQNGGKV